MVNEGSVFISYSSKDILYADGLVSILKELGVTYFKAPEMIPAGSNYAKEIPKAIQDCACVLLLVSKNSQESIWVEKELDSAVNLRKQIIPICLDEEPLNDMFRFYLNNVQMISYDTEKDKLIAFFKEQFEELVGVEEQKSELEEQIRRMNIRRQNILGVNRAPIECRYCKGSLTEKEKGIYICNNCGNEQYDYLQTVKRFLQEKGAATAIEIERETGVPRRVVDSFFREGYLEVPKMEKYRVTCPRCGARIRSGVLCDKCNYILGKRSR